MTKTPLADVARPRLPLTPAVTPYLERIDAAGWYSNFGPLEREFTAALADWFNVEPDNVVLTASGTSALTVAMMATRRADAHLCLMPAWTFAATGAAALNAGLTPYFVDCDLQTWSPDPQKLIDGALPTAISTLLPVLPFGTVIDLAQWSRLAKQLKASLVVDAAAGFDTVSSRPDMIGDYPLIISLHATKIFGVGEGGVIISRDRAVIKDCRERLNFGFTKNRAVRVVGINAKMSEYHAAVGLAALKQWPDRRAQWEELNQAYQAMLSDCGLSRFAPETLATTANICLDRAAERLMPRLDGAGIGYRRWWGLGCHNMPAYKDFATGPLTNSDRIASTSLGLPFHLDLTGDDLCRLGDLLADFAAQTPANVTSAQATDQHPAPALAASQR